MPYAEPMSFEMIEEGAYDFDFKKCEVVTSSSFDDPTVDEEQYKFVFEVEGVETENGKPFLLSRFTRTMYGNDKANLTLLLDGMCGRRLTKDEFNTLEANLFAKLQGPKYRGLVGTKIKQSGQECNIIKSVKRRKSAENSEQPAVGVTKTQPAKTSGTQISEQSKVRAATRKVEMAEAMEPVEDDPFETA